MSVPDKVKQAWTELPEKEKKFFCKCIFKEEPQRFKEWMNTAGITSGFRPLTISKREVKADLLDKVFLDIRNGDYARFRIKNYFCTYYPELNDKFLQFVKDEKADISKDLQKLLERFRENIVDNPFLDLFCSSAEWMVSDWEDDLYDLEDDPNITEVDNEQKLEDSFNHLAELPMETNENIEKLALGIKTDIEALIQILRDAFESGESLRNKVFEAAESVGIEPREWRSQEEFRELIELIREKKIELMTSGNLSDFYLKLEQLLACCRIVHKSQATRSKWEVLKGAACAQLTAAIASGNTKGLPRSKELSPMEWIEWSLTLTDFALDELKESLESSLLSLAQLICEVERHHLDFQFIEQEVVKDSVDSNSAVMSLGRQEPIEASEEISTSEFNDSIHSDGVIPQEESQEDLPSCTNEDIEASNDLIKEVQSEVTAQVNENESNETVIMPQVVASNELVAEVQPEVAALMIKDVLTYTMITPQVAIRSACSSTELTDQSSLLWQLLKDNRLSLAYHISLCLEKQGIETISSVPSEIIKGLILSPCLSSQYGVLAEAATECGNNIGKLLSNGQNSGHNSVGLNLLAFGLSLRPTLLASQTHFNELLLSLNPNSDLPALDELRSAIINYTHIGIDLNPTILKGMREHVAWEQNLRSHIERCKVARETNRHSSIIFAPTTNVWRAWQDPDHPFGAILDNVINNRQDKIELVKAGIRQWSNQGFIREQIDRTDHVLRGRNAKLRPIEARALKVVVSRTLEMLELVKEWLDLINDEAVGFSDKEQKRAEACRIDLLKHLSNAIVQVDKIVGKQPDVMIQGAAHCLRLALIDLKNLFDPQYSDSMTQIPFEYLLHNSLLLVTQVEFNEQWEPLNCSQKKIMAELVKQVEIMPDLDTVIGEHCKDGNLLSAKRLLNYSKCIEVFERDKLELIEDEYDKAEETFKGRLDARIRNVRKEALKALHYNIVTSQDYEQFRSSIDAIDTGEILLYMHCESVMDGIIQRIEESKQKRIQIVKDSLNKEKDICRKYPEACAKIMGNLDNGDFSIAEEHISLLKKGRELPQIMDREDIFCGYYPGIADSIFNWLKDKRNLSDVGMNIRARSALGAIDATSLSETDTESSDQLIKSWDQLKVRGGDFATHLKSVINGLGFEIEKDGIALPKEFRFRDKKDRFCWVEVKTKVVEGRDKCPIPSYASQAKGRYQFLCCWELGAESEIFDQYRSRSKPQPTFILSFNRATNQQRRELAKLCYEKKPRRSQLFIDEILAVHSACQPRYKRLSTLFQCTFPFTIAEPYMTTASHVPQEMFYGRQKAREEIIKTTGTNLVFGGRQLGKTALLRDVADREHNPAIGSIVKWIDLKTEHIGFTRKAKEIWSVIGEKLYEDGIVPSAQASRPDTVKNNILKWLKEDEDRRILLLLDEADAFLKFDREGEDKDGQFANLLHLKGLMEESERRFKIVFAGLHNVQRTAKDINTPLAHLGTPICIGPLLDDGEIDEAINLVRIPFETLGYRFESDDLVWTILWHTISYPSLIQLYCKHLLEYMVDRNRDQIITKKAPPFTIKSQHIDGVFQEKGLRDAILEKFRLTLDLDQRYRLIALIIASECTKNIKKGAPIQEEFDVAWVRKEALHLWPQGFRDDQSHEAFRTILEEMIGLGILRRADGNKFSLRNLGVVKLLGTEQEIENEIYDIMDLDGPVEYNEVLTFRRVLNGRNLSPLTFSQENDIFKLENGAIVLFGSRIAGIENIESFLIDASKKQKFEYTRIRENDLPSFKSQIQKLISSESKKTDNLARLIVIGTDTPWSERWIEEILKSEVLKRRKLSTRVLFLADSNSCWSWSNIADRQILDRLANSGLITMSLRPFTKDAIKLCLESMNIPIGIEQSFESIRNATGNWLFPLQKFVDMLEDSGDKWRDQLAKFSIELTSQHLIELFDIRPEAFSIFEEIAGNPEPSTILLRQINI